MIQSNIERVAFQDLMNELDDQDLNLLLHVSLNIFILVIANANWQKTLAALVSVQKIWQSLCVMVARAYKILSIVLGMPPRYCQKIMKSGAILALNRKIIAENASQHIGVWGVNVVLVCSYIGFMGRINLSNRLFMWMLTSNINLIREHAHSKNWNYFNLNWFLNTQCYVVGQLLLSWGDSLQIWIQLTMIGAAMLGYTGLCWNRWNLSEDKFLQYAVSWELIISLGILPAFLVADLIGENQTEFFLPYILVDVFLKVTRTYALHYYHKGVFDGMISPPTIDTQNSWERSISDESFETHWEEDYETLKFKAA